MILVSVATLFVVTLTIVMTFALRSDVAFLDKQTRNAVRTEERLSADIAAIKGGFAALQSTAPSRDAASGTEPAPLLVALVPAAPVVVEAPARIVKIGAAVPRECAFHPGDPQGLMDCIRRQQEWIGRAANPKYQ